MKKVAKEKLLIMLSILCFVHMLLFFCKIIHVSLTHRAFWLSSVCYITDCCFLILNMLFRVFLPLLKSYHFQCWVLLFSFFYIQYTSNMAIVPDLPGQMRQTLYLQFQNKRSQQVTNLLFFFYIIAKCLNYIENVL